MRARRTSHRTRTRPLTGAALLAALVGAVVAVAAVVPAAAVEVHIDPGTGEIVAPPAAPPAAARSAAPAGDGDADVIEAPSGIIGGGYVVKMRGREKFRLTGGTSAGGDAVAECDHSGPTAHGPR